ncbi:MAG: isoprenoid biosynthesis glyoxalase ElbB [Desulfobulbaceae bacterium]|nr:isoprenoid biosynthesis glyoxalase ElbB [Desulfobulbaceae bacterium]
MTATKKIAVILSGCGNKDGAEIHESVMTLWAIHKHGADYQCFAPNIRQHHVLNFITDKEMAEERNVLVESARIARGDIKDLANFDPTQYDALIIPGGLGAAKNLSTYAFAGSDCEVNEELATAIRAMKNLNKPIGALCIAPVLLAKVLGDITVTIGSDQTTIENLGKMGASHTKTDHGEVAIDRANKIVTTPCYMLNARVDQIGDGAENVIKAILAMM